MTDRNKTKITIDGKTFKLTGEESEEYMKMVAAYIDEKIEEIKNSPNARFLNAGMRSILTSINIADDYFKEVQKNKALSEEIIKLKMKSSKFNEERFSNLTKENKKLKALIDELENEKLELIRVLGIKDDDLKNKSIENVSLFDGLKDE